MITWLQDTFGKHHRTFLGALLVVIIGSFVFYGAAGSGSRGESFNGKLPHATPTGTINLTDARSTKEARELAAFRSFAASPDDFLQSARIVAFNRQNGGAETASRGDRLFAFFVDTVDRLAAADAFGIPRPGEKQLAEHIRKHRYFAGTAGEFNPATLKQISEMARDRLNLDEARLQNALANDWRLSRLASATLPDNAPSLNVLASRLAENERAQWNVSQALYSRDEYKCVVTPDEKALAAYFEKVKENHRIPKRVKLRYARIPGAVTEQTTKPADEELIATAERRKDKFPLFGTVANTIFLTDNRPALETLWREEKAGETVAAKISESLGTAMPLGNSRPDNAAVDSMIKAAGLTPIAIPAYGSDSIPKIAGIPAALLERALDLSDRRWRTAAIPYGDSAYVFIFDEEIPARIPALAEVRDRVEADRVKAETERQYAEVAATKSAEIAKTMKSGKTFAEAATAAGLKVGDPLSFQLGSVPENLKNHTEILRLLPVGAVSPALAAGRDRVIIHLVSRTVTPAPKNDPVANAYQGLIGTAAARSSIASVPGIAD